ncbi:hypothetical protein [Knoellia koreensis]|uniref:Uncharacterized protein n=1 Tax=Knoellia koreensis TaxID=2730921 RepID=A0A849HF03_9MICO|nr:hypothetical protein [Knoellia sp. DB2414S]NNM48336.1 hypothetical protein [Knoellia sp. DB2414S]
MSKLARRFLTDCVVTLAAWLGIVAPSADSVEVCATPVLASAYIDTLSVASPPNTTPHCGPPVSYDRHTAYDAVHLGLRGVVAPSDVLRPMGRQFVHLSVDRDTARTVGSRKSDVPVICRTDRLTNPSRRTQRYTTTRDLTRPGDITREEAASGAGGWVREDSPEIDDLLIGVA